MDSVQEAFLTDIVETYQDMLYGYCARCMRYNPKLMLLIPDVVQEVYMKAASNADLLMHHGNIPGWLKKSCHFSLLNILRQQEKHREILYPTVETLQAALQNSPISLRRSGDDDSITLQEVLEATEAILTEEEQAIFNDYFLDHLSTAETARLNCMTRDAVRGKISRIRKKLKAYFAG